MKKLLLFVLMLVFTSSIFAQTTVWNPAANEASTGLWSEAANWSTAEVPTADNKVVFNVDPAVMCTVDSNSEAGRIVLGDGGPGKLTVKSGTTLTLGNQDWTSFAYNDSATFIVEANASVTIDHHNYMGMGDGAVLNMEVYGSVTSTQNIGMDRGDAGAVANVTIYEGGVLCARYANDDSFGAGAKLDIRGGTFKFTQSGELEHITKWIADGKIVAYGGGGILTAEVVEGEAVVTSSMDTTAPTIASTNPANEATGVITTAGIEITFSEPMNTDSVESAITIDPSIANVAYSWSGNTLTIKGDEMAALTAYTVTISTLAEDLVELSLDNEYSFGFTTFDPDAAPLVVSNTPANNEADVEADADVVITFTKAMNTTDVEAKITTDLLNPVYTWSDEDKTVTISHDVLSWETAYTVTVPAGVLAADATALADELVINFTVKAHPITDIRYTPTADSLWNNPANWQFNTVPLDGNWLVKIGQEEAANCVLDTTATIHRIRTGDTDDGNGGDTLFIATGAVLNAKDKDWSSIGYKKPATLVIEEGGTFNAGHHLWIGKEAEANTNVHINGGTLSVGKMFALDFDNKGSKDTLFLNGGTLDLAQINDTKSIGDNSQINITGGQIEIVGDKVSVINDYIAAGKIVAHGGEGTLKVGVVDGETIVKSEAPTTSVWKAVEGGSGLWSDAANWSTVDVPGNNKVVIEKTNDQECVLDIESTVNHFVMGDVVAGGTLRIKDGGTLNIQNAETDWSCVGQNSTASLILETGAVVNNSSVRFEVGLQPGANATLTMDGGALNTYDMNIGKSFGATGSVIMNSGTITITDKSIDIGDFGTATLTMNGGDIILADDLYIAKNSDDESGTASTGTLTMNGGKIYMAEDLKAGNAGLGILTLNDGVIEIGDRMYLGEADGTAKVYIKGGELIIHDRINAIDGESFIDITDDGKITLDGDQVSKIDDFVTANQIVSAAGEGTVEVNIVDGNTVVTGTGTSVVVEPDPTLPVFPSVANNGPFPTGDEEKRSDSPFDTNSGLTTDIVYEYTAYKGTPTIDGDWNEEDAWNKVPWTEFQDCEAREEGKDNEYGFIHDTDFASTIWGGASDFAAWFKIMHDDNNVYVLTMRIDDDIDNSGATVDTPSDIWQNDIYQMILDSRAPGDYDTASPGAEVGFGHIGADEVYNFWANGQQNPATELLLADGNSTSASASATGKAIKYKMHAGVNMGGTIQDVHVMELAFKKYDGEFADESVGMLSFAALDRDNGVRFNTILQFGQGIVAEKNNTLYTSILFSEYDHHVPTSVSKIDDASMELTCYPNPIGDMTRISYVLDNNEHVLLNVYDITGKIVRTLVSGKQSSGRNTINFDTSSLNSGIYFLNLRTGSDSVTKKIVK